MGLGHFPGLLPQSPLPNSSGGTTFSLAGTLAARPPASFWNNGWGYLATDQSGGTLYRSTGTSWAQCGAGVSSGLPTMTNGQLLIGQTGLIPVAAAPTSDPSMSLVGGSGTLAINSSFNGIINGRLTLTSGVPVTTSDVTAATTLYFTPYGGNFISAYPSGAAPVQTYSPGEINVQLTTTAQNGTTSTTLKTITGLTSTSQLAIGMVVSGTGVALNNTIASVDSTTQVTCANVNSSNATNLITFKILASQPWDVFFNPGDSSLQLAEWNSSSARATAIGLLNGAYVNTGIVNSGSYNSIAANVGRYLGTIVATAVNGQTEDSVANRFVWNYYNRRLRPMSRVETATSWSYGTATIRQANANTANKLNFVLGISEDPVTAQVQCPMSGTAGVVQTCLIGLDVTNASSGTVWGGVGVGFSMARYNGFPAAGPHALNWNEIAHSTTTFYGINTAGPFQQSGITGEVWG